MKYSNCFYSIPTRWRKLPDDVLSIIISYIPNKKWFNNMIQKSMEKWNIVIHKVWDEHYQLILTIDLSIFKSATIEFSTYDLCTAFHYRYYTVTNSDGGGISWYFDSNYLLTWYSIHDVKHQCLFISDHKYKWSFDNGFLTCYDDDGQQRSVRIRENIHGHCRLSILPV